VSRTWGAGLKAIIPAVCGVLGLLVGVFVGLDDTTCHGTLGTGYCDTHLSLPWLGGGLIIGATIGFLILVLLNRHLSRGAGTGWTVPPNRPRRSLKAGAEPVTQHSDPSQADVSVPRLVGCALDA
jgi:hypothetical protein